MSQYDDADFDQLIRTLTENFNLLADEVQLLSDRKTILEHKLRFAHEQYQTLADKYAPADLEILNTLAKLQLPPDLQIQSPERANFVPLPLRRPSGAKQQTAEAIRDGRKAAQRLASLKGWTNTSTTGGPSGSLSGTASSNMRTSRRGTSSPTLLELDFTVQGKKSQLLCPFASKTTALNLRTSPPMSQPTSNPEQYAGQESKAHHPEDPICVAIHNESLPSPARSATGSAAKCPIRYMDQHSPEEVAQYFESHKHEIPRSHEVCVKRYQRNEEDIRKLDAKYGNLVNMLQGLGQKHQPLLATKEDRDMFGPGKKSTERVENWAKAVSVESVEVMNAAPQPAEDEDEREGRFDRPLKEVRVGESPSRPWGIQVPFVEDSFAGPPLRPAPGPEDVFVEVSPQPAHEEVAAPAPLPEKSRPTGKCPFGQHGAEPAACQRQQSTTKPVEAAAPPAFLQQQDLAKIFGNGAPQMVFTGPVFIGYPLDQAMALMQQWQAGSSATGRP